MAFVSMDIEGKKDNSGILSCTYLKINSQWVKELSTRYATGRLLRKYRALENGGISRTPFAKLTFSDTREKLLCLCLQLVLSGYENSLQPKLLQKHLHKL